MIQQLLCKSLERERHWIEMWKRGSLCILNCSFWLTTQQNQCCYDNCCHLLWCTTFPWTLYCTHFLPPNPQNHKLLPTTALILTKDSTIHAFISPVADYLRGHQHTHYVSFTKHTGNCLVRINCLFIVVMANDQTVKTQRNNLQPSDWGLKIDQ